MRHAWRSAPSVHPGVHPHMHPAARYASAPVSCLICFRLSPKRTQDAQVVHVRQRPHVGRQQRQAWPRVDGQLVARAVMAPDGLATLQGGQGDRNVFRKHIVRAPCKTTGTTVVHCVDEQAGLLLCLRFRSHFCDITTCEVCCRRGRRSIFMSDRWLQGRSEPLLLSSCSTAQ